MNTGQAAAAPECIVTDSCNGTGDVNAGQATAAHKRNATNGRDGVGDNGILATRNECICGSFNNRIAIISGIIVWIIVLYFHTNQATTVHERIFADGGGGVGDVDAGQASAGTERIITDGSDGVGDVDAGQISAAGERTYADGCDRVGDNGILAACNERVAGSFNDGVAVIAGIKFGITSCYCDVGQTAAALVSVTYCISINLD